jgi:hypothetical protein
MKKKQRLVAVRVSTQPTPPGAPAITPIGGEPLEELLTSWRIVQIQPLSAEGAGAEYAALLLLEEAPSEATLGRPGFGDP